MEVIIVFLSFLQVWAFSRHGDQGCFKITDVKNCALLAILSIDRAREIKQTKINGAECYTVRT